MSNPRLSNDNAPTNTSVSNNNQATKKPIIYKYVDTGAIVPEDSTIITESKKKYAVTYDAAGQICQKRHIQSEIAIYSSRLVFADNCEDVPLNLEIIKRRNKKYVIAFEQGHQYLREVQTYNWFCHTQRKKEKRDNNQKSSMNVSNNQLSSSTEQHTDKEVTDQLQASSNSPVTPQLNKAFKFVDGQNRIPENAVIVSSLSGKKYAVTYDKDDNIVNTGEVKTAKNISQKRFVFVDDKSNVPVGTPIVKKEQKRYVYSYDAAGNIVAKREVKTAQLVSETRLLFVDDRTDVPDDLEIVEENEKKFAIKKDAAGAIVVKREVKKAKALYKQRFEFLDDRTPVPADLEIIEENQKKFAIKKDADGEIVIKREISVAKAVRKQRIVFLDDRMLVPMDMELIVESSKKYAVRRDDNGEIILKREVASDVQASQRRLVYEDDKKDVPPGMNIIKEGKVKYAVICDQNGDVLSKRRVRPAGSLYGKKNKRKNTEITDKQDDAPVLDLPFNNDCTITSTEIEALKEALQTTYPDPSPSDSYSATDKKHKSSSDLQSDGLLPSPDFLNEISGAPDAGIVGDLLIPSNPHQDQEPFWVPPQPSLTSDTTYSGNDAMAGLYYPSAAQAECADVMQDSPVLAFFDPNNEDFLKSLESPEWVQSKYKQPNNTNENLPVKPSWCAMFTSTPTNNDGLNIQSIKDRNLPGR